MHRFSTKLAGGLVALACGFPCLAQDPQRIVVTALAAAPKIDGELGDWSGAWQEVVVKPALEPADRAKFGLDPAGDRNQTGTLTLRLKAGVAGGRLYLAVSLPDPTQDLQSRGWEWRGDKYVQGKRADDMLALRFHMDGEFDRSMLSSKQYKVDVWLWSAGRSNPVGIADDFMHSISTRLIEDAAEYSLPGGATVYIKKMRDAGTPSFKPIRRPKTHSGDLLPSFEAEQPAGSAADVAAKGVWKAGHWQIEFSRALDTGHADDVVFKPGQALLGQIAVFNHGDAEHKSVSEPLKFDFSAIKQE